MTDNMLVYANLELKNNYKLLPLTPDILKAIEKKEKLTIKSSSNTSRHDLVITSEDTTFQLRQKNHSNTQLLIQNGPASLPTQLNDGNTTLVGIANFQNELEITKTTGSIEYNHLPIYHGNTTTLSDFMQKLQQEKNTHKVSVEQVLQNSSISEKEFHHCWIQANGSEIDGKAVILGEDYITEVLSLIINTIIANQLDPKGTINLAELYKLISQTEPDITIDIIHTVLLKNSKDGTSHFNDLEYTLDLDKISKWYGIHCLKKTAMQQNLEIDEFLINWRSTLPSSLSVNLDLKKLLKGYYYSPQQGLIRYINRQTLPSDPTSRFKNLFLLQSTWTVEEMEPFIADLNTKNLKAASYIMKYARVKKQGSKSIVISR